MLAKLHLLHLLKTLYGRVYVPQSVYADQFRLYLTELIRRQDICVSPALVERLRREVLGE